MIATPYGLLGYIVQASQHDWSWERIVAIADDGTPMRYEDDQYLKKYSPPRSWHWKILWLPADNPWEEVVDALYAARNELRSAFRYTDAQEGGKTPQIAK